MATATSKLDHCPAIGDRITADSLREPKFWLDTGPLSKTYPVDPSDPELQTLGQVTCTHHEPRNGRGSVTLCWPYRDNGLRLRCSGRIETATRD